MLELGVARFIEFRNKLRASFPKRSDALLELTDALSGNVTAKSPVELSLSPLFSRSYSSLHDAVDNFFHATDFDDTDKCLDHFPNQSGLNAQEKPNTQKSLSAKDQKESKVLQLGNNKNPTEQRTRSRICRLQLLADFLPKPERHLFYLLVTDATPHPRPFARTLEDRHIVYMPNPAPGNKPIGVGHKYSTVAVLPEKNFPLAHPWAIPLSIEQIPSYDTDNLVASRQIRSLLTDTNLPFLNNLTVNVADSLYCTVPFLGSVGDIDNLITVVRSPSNRVFYFQPSTQELKKRGHPTWLGKRFDMKNPETWGTPTRTCEHAMSMASGKNVILELEIWDDLLMKGNRGVPMNKSPFTLIHCRLLNTDGSLVFTRPLWLIVFGKRRMELSSVVAWQCYRQRYNIEHFFRFGKNHLMMGRYQTPVVEHEENWLDIVGLAYFQLWMASPLARTLPRPWERYSIPKDNSNLPSPSTTQRDLERIIRQVEKLPSPPKPRGKSPGRQPGHSPGKRSKREVVFKGKKQTKKKAA